MSAYCHLVPAECPRAEPHLTALLVEGKVLDIDGAGALVDGDGNPQNLPVIVHHHIGLKRHFILAIRTNTRK